MIVRRLAQEVRIRQMEAADSEVVRGLCQQLGYPSAPATFRCRLKELQGNPYHEVFVAVLDHKVVGWAHIYEVPSLLSPSTAELGGLVVADGYRRRGIGCKLIDALDRWANDRGMRSLLLATRSDRVDARAFYRHLRFSLDYDATYLRRAVKPAQREVG